MNWRSWLPPALLLVAPLVAALPEPGAAQKSNPQKPAITVTWKKIVLDRNFRSEGVGVADVNKDGKPDVIVGDCWYEAPKDSGGDWKRHIIRADRKFDLNVYSDSFCCFADDWSGDGFPDVIVIPFPGNPCYWYENPGAKGGKWKAHLLTNSACNETPIFIDLFRSGKKQLVMGWNPQKDAKDLKKGNYDDRGELCYFIPGKDPTQPWQRVSISGPSTPGKAWPGTARFAHGLGHGDVNGDGRIDILVPQGWWEQPEKLDGSPWKFHATRITDACADMYTYDIDGDGLADVVSTSAHNYGMWWSQQTKAGTFVQRQLFPRPAEVAKLRADHGLSKEELEVLKAINAVREEQKRAPWAVHPVLMEAARAQLKRGVGESTTPPRDMALGGHVEMVVRNDQEPDLKKAFKATLEDWTKRHPKLLAPNLELGISHVKGKGWLLLIGTRKQFSLPSQTHALHCVDLNGDGLKDLVTGRRWWAHGPRGDAGPNDPAYLYWFEAKRYKDRMVLFTPHVIDEDSGIGTSFAVADMNGDGLLDIIVSNKKGTHVFLQGRTPVK